MIIISIRVALQPKLLELGIALFFSLLFFNACGSEQNIGASQPNSSKHTSSASQDAAGIPTITPATVITTAKPVSLSPATPISAPASLTIVGTNQDWQYNWLKGIPCKAPCFENITPGVTTIEKAEAILKSNSLIVDVSNFSIKRSLVWNWKYSKKNILDGSYAAYASYNSNRPDEVITGIDPFLDINFTLNDVIKTYGEPSHVQIGARPDYEHIGGNFIYNLEVVYLPQGFAIRNGDYKKKPVISGDLSFTSVGFFVPNNINTYSKPNLLVSWQGFKSFEFYCLKAYPANEICSK